MSITPFEHPLLSGLLGDEEVAAQFAPEAELAALVAVEGALADSEAEHGAIPAEAGAAISTALASFRPDVARLRAAAARDGVVVPELVRQLGDAVGEPHRRSLHVGATSQDVIDTALVLRLKPLVAMLAGRLDAVVDRIAGLEHRFGERTLMAMTRMQPAVPIPAAHRIASWRAPLERHRDRLEPQAARLLVVQFGGAAGTLDGLGDRASAVRATLAARLGLGDAPQWHSQRDGLADFAGWLSLVTGSLGKFGQDVALMAQIGADAISLSGGGGSSTMPHKHNPVAAEMLVALARFNAVQVSGMHQALVHEQERSGAAWTLEWLLLPQMLTATASALRLAAELADRIDGIGR